MKDSELRQIPQADPRRRFLARRQEIEGAIARVLERKARNFSYQYFYTDEQYLLRHAQLLAASFDVTDPSYCPWRDHPAPRWRRKPPP
jgi:hypothetical protein